LYEPNDMLSTAVGLSIVIPAYNEGRRLERALPSLLAAVDVSATEIIVVDDGSADDTADVASSMLASLPLGRVVRLPANCGKGGATRIGVSQARGAAIAFMDADMATDPSGLGELLSALRSADVAIGSRAHPDSIIHDVSRSRELMGRGFNRLTRIAGGFDHRDTQCGFKGFRGPVAKSIFHLSRINGYAFDVELLLLASRLGLRVREVPVTWTAVPGSTVRPLRDPLPMALDVVRSSLRWRGFRPVPALTAVAPDGESHEVAAGLRAHLRAVDPVVPWERGAVALLPCTSGRQVERVASRLSRRLPGVAIQTTAVAPAHLIPRSGGLLRTALAA